MRSIGIRATCERCGGEFTLFQLYNAAASKEGSCPYCSTSFGLPRVGPVASQADRALAALAANLRALSDERGRLRIDPASVFRPLAEVLDVGADPSEAEHGSPASPGLHQAAS